MWKKCLAFSGVLGLIVLLDPSPTPAQPGGSGFGRPGFGGPPGSGFGGPPGGMSGERREWRGFGGPPGGTSTVQPGTFGQPNAYGGQPAFGGTPPSGGMSGERREWRGYGGTSGGTSGERPSFGGPPGSGTGGERPSFGGSPGSSGGPPSGGRPRFTPEQGWTMLQNLTKSPGADVVDLSRVPPETQAFLKRIAERDGSIPLPESGTMTKDQYMAHFARSEAAKADFASRGGVSGGPGGSSDSGRDRSREDWRQSGDWRQGGGDWRQGGDWNRDGQNQKKEEEARPVALRYGKLPKDLPGWYEELDKDKDGQVALHEWRKDGREMSEFTKMDLNGDGLLTADEYQRFTREKAIQTKVDAYVESDGAVRPATWNVGASDGGERRPGTGGPPGGMGGRPPYTGGSPSGSSGDSKSGDSKDKERERERERGKGWNRPRN